MRGLSKHLSTFAIANLLHVDPGSVANWIDQNLLKAHRTPGGHRRVAVEDLLDFLRKHNMPIPDELNTSPPKVLVVDDEPAITQLISRAIKSAHPDYEILEAHDGFTAGTICGTQKPDVVILDLRMPGIDGYEVCRQIKGQESTRHVEVIAITAYPSPNGEKSILECGARICLNKPLEMDELLKELEAAIQH